MLDIAGARGVFRPAMKPTPKIILLIPSAREYDRGVLRGIVEYAHIHGPWTFYDEPPAYLNPPNRKQVLVRMKGWHADGVIAPQEREDDIRELRLPSVVIVSTRHLPGNRCQVVTENAAVGNMAAEHLRSLGLRHFAYCGLGGMEWAAERCTHFCSNMAAAGFGVQVYNPRDPGSGESWYTEETRLSDWLAALPKPAGLMACNDDRARMIAEICRVRGIRVPDDIAILGVDNDEHVCNRATPPLSSVAMATERAGYETAALLDKLMARQAAVERTVVVHPTQVFTRQSTDLIAISDAVVVRAVRFIRNNRMRVIGVKNVAAAAGVSRRALQDRFRRTTGQTVLQSIHRSRLDSICRLLTETNLPMSEIASAIGYNEDAHIARFFARRTGMTPGQYRRKFRKP
jgi:LacI family transcriptional regulator